MARRTDHNQAEIVEGLRSLSGVVVQDLSQLGKGCPDILVAYKNRNYLLEIKSGDRAPKLTDCEEKWIRQWTGQVAVITTLQDAIEVIMQDFDFGAGNVDRPGIEPG